LCESIDQSVAERVRESTVLAFSRLDFVGVGVFVFLDFAFVLVLEAKAVSGMLTALGVMALTLD
jgi:hypothetical protein